MRTSSMTPKQGKTFIDELAFYRYSIETAACLNGFTLKKLVYNKNPLILLNR